MIVFVQDMFVHNSSAKWSALHFFWSFAGHKFLGNFATVEQLSNFWSCQESWKIACRAQRMSICQTSERAAAPKPHPHPLRLCHNLIIDIWWGEGGSLPRGCLGFYSQAENIHWWTSMSIIAAECSRIAGGGGSDAPLLATLAPTWPPTPPAPSWYKIVQLHDHCEKTFFGWKIGWDVKSGSLYHAGQVNDFILGINV